MKKIIWILIGLMVFNGTFFAFKSGAEDAPAFVHCYDFMTRYGDFFGNYERAEYDHGLLQLHLQVLRPIYSTSGWFQTFYFYSPDCSKFEAFDVDIPLDQMSLPGLMQNFSLRFTSATHYDIWNDENNSKINCTGCSVDIPGTFKDGTPYSQLSYYGHRGDYQPLMVTTTLPIKQSFIPKEPVIIIPGILATVMKSGNENIWPNVTKLLADPKSKFLDDLQLNAQGVPTDVSAHADQILEKIDYLLGAWHYSDLLTKDLEDQGYQKDRDLFTIGYDWRLSVEQNSRILSDKINEIISNSAGMKVNFIAHSLGGLILKNYLKNTSNDDKIDKIFFAGTPNLGSAKAGKMLMFGDNLDIPLLSADELKFLARNMPSIYDLLPSEKYYQYTQGFYDDLTSNSKTIFGYQETKGLLEANQKNMNLLKQAEDLHSNLDELDLSTKPYQSFDLVGCGVYTIKTITKMYEGQPTLAQTLTRDTKYKITADSGDGTVLMPSAVHLKVTPGQRWFFNGAVHTNMLADQNIRNFVLDKITAEQKTYQAASTAEQCGLNGKLFSFDSSVDLKIKDSNGKEIEPGNGIYLDKIADNVFVFLPEGADQKYKVEATPKTSKPVAAQVTEYKNNNQKNYYYQDVNLNGDQYLNFDVGGLDQNDQVYKTDPQGLDTEAVVPVAEVSAADDAVPPVTVVKSKNNVLPTDSTLVLKSDDREIIFSATDDQSGVAATYYSLDSGESWRVPKNDGSILVPLGQDKIIFFSIDKNQNEEDLQTLNFDWQDYQQNVIISAPSASSGGTNSTGVPDDQDDPSVDDLTSDITEENPVDIDTSLNTNTDSKLLSGSIPPINITLQSPNPVNTLRPIQNIVYANMDPYIFLWTKLHEFGSWACRLILF